MKIRKRYLIPIVLLAVILLGPRRSFPDFDGKVASLNIPFSDLDAYISKKEAAVKNLKPDNEARIVWADSIRRTPYSIVYLHGWSASQEEGDPIHEELAKRYGANLYLSRLAGHGIDDKDSFLKLTPKDLVESAKEALAIGRLIGEKTILMSCSTGGTLSIYLASQNPELIHAQLLYSPNIEIFDNTSEMLTAPWGKQLSEVLVGKYNSFTPPKGAEQYWTTTYRSEGLICLKSLIETTMIPSIWKKVNQPLFMGYYYKNEEEQDHTVSVAYMQEFYKNVATPEGKKRKVAFANAGAHVVVSRFHSKELDLVRKESFAFMEEVLGLQPIVQ